MARRGQRALGRPVTDTIMADRSMVDNDVRAVRTGLGWSQDEPAQRSGLSRMGIGAIETGRLVLSTAAELALAGAMSCTVETLFRLAWGKPLEEAVG
jgi:DNA-binding XRE family transcriptional regulator